MRHMTVASILGAAVILTTAACGQQTPSTQAASPVSKVPISQKATPTSNPTSDAPPKQEYPLTPTSIAGLEMPLDETQVEQLTERLGEPRVLTTPHCQYALKNRLKGKQRQWGDLTLATDPMKDPDKFSYWYLSGRNLPANLKPKFALGVDGTLDALQETYPKSKYILHDTYRDSTLTGDGLPVWRESNGKVLSAQSREVDCLNRR